MPNIKVVIVEQVEGKLFNRGKLINIGCKEYFNKTQYFMTHDIDINPTEDTISRYYTKPVKSNIIMGIYTSSCNTLGGIIKFRQSTFEQSKGFPNNCWGWGIEDKVLQNRCNFFGIHIEKNILNNDPILNTLFSIHNDINDRVKTDDFDNRTAYEYNIFPMLSFNRKKQHIEQCGGLDNLEYKVIRRETLNEMVDHIILDI